MDFSIIADRMILKDLKLLVQFRNLIHYVTKFKFIPSSQLVMAGSMTVGDCSTVRLVETFVPCFLDDIGTSWVLKPHGFKVEEGSRTWLSRSGVLHLNGKHGMV